ncbi:FAD-binding protein [Nocardia flavorosea]|uniref:FAD-binding protein n=2 Tax=Nocardia flavorosea TaxID=53429 RepID=A0A846YCI9_9NOCA|nr:FAD-linked oxidase C-terminal domain-containing protein [Nocardia flavorosea]NKY57316.1 FAD-binding protein [Nocardia flavorosea]
MDSALRQLTASLPAGVVTSHRETLEKYRNDHIFDPAAGRPVAAARPQNIEQVQTCVRWAARHATPIVTRGAGTGLAGGARAVDGCLVLSTEKMKAVTIDSRSRVAHVEPGALNGEVKQAAAAAGLFYPPDPGSYRISSIGGNIATNAGGLCCVKYGVTSNYVLGLSVVLADGRLVRLGGPTVKNVAGLPLTQLFVGSEGVLGIIVGATLRLIVPPPDPSTVVATFPTVSAAGRAVVGSGSTSRPSMMELLDNRTINLVEDFRRAGLDRSAAAMLIAQFDNSAEAAAFETVARASEGIEVHRTDDPAEGEMFVEIRRATGPAVERLGPFLAEDIAVPIEALPDALRRIEDLAAELSLDIPVVAHAGDGNLHPAIMYRPADRSSTARAHSAFRRIAEIALSLDGTITGEHGIGRTKRPLLRQQLGDDVMNLTALIKNALDPGGLLNPGVAI